MNKLSRDRLTSPLPQVCRKELKQNTKLEAQEKVCADSIWRLQVIRHVGFEHICVSWCDQMINV